MGIRAPWMVLVIGAAAATLSLVAPPRARAATATPALPCTTPALTGSLGATIWHYQQDLAQQGQAANSPGEAQDWCLLLRLLQGQTGQRDWTADALYWKGLGHYWLSTGAYAAAVGAFDQEAQYWTLAGEPTWGDADEITANSYRPVVDLYAAEQASGPSGPSGKYAPANGTLLGYYVQQDPAVGSFPTAARIAAAYDGRQPAILLYYVDWGQSVPAGYLTAARDLHAALEIALQPEQGLGPVLSDGGYLQSLASQLGQSGVPVFLRFANEMNGNWVPWGMQPAPGDPTFAAHAARYVAAFRKVAEVMHAQAPNVAMVWAPNDQPTTGTEAYWPGSAYVDWVGVSAYLDASAPGQPGADARQSLLANISWIYDHYAAKKPIMIAEGGIGHYDHIAGQDVTPWAQRQLDAFLAGLPRLYPDIRALVWWSADKPAASDYTLSNDPSLLQTFARDTRSPWFLTSPTGTSPVRYVPLGQNPVPADASISAYVHDWHQTPARVVYLLDGRQVGTADTPPWTLSLQGLAAGAHTLTLDAYGPAGHLDASQTVTFTVAGFTDLADYGWAAPDIRALAAKGIIQGVSPTRFDPGAPVTREQFAALLTRAFALVPSNSTSYSDVSQSSWAYADIQAAGTLIPSSGSTFAPTEPISREDVAAALGTLLSGSGQGTSPASPASVLAAFQDASSITPSLRPAVAVAVSAGILRGFPGGSFEPRQSLSRAQAAVILARALGVVKPQGS